MLEATSRIKPPVASGTRPSSICECVTQGAQGDAVFRFPSRFSAPRYAQVDEQRRLNDPEIQHRAEATGCPRQPSSFPWRGGARRLPRLSAARSRRRATSFFFQQRFDDPPRRERRFGDFHVERRERVVDGVGDGGGRRDGAAFADALLAEARVGRGAFPCDRCGSTAPRWRRAAGNRRAWWRAAGPCASNGISS